jgi:hypothetical protein
VLRSVWITSTVWGRLPMSGELYMLGNCGYQEDQVPRLLAFRQGHPEWRIHYSFGLWRAWRELPEVDGGEEHVRVRLDHLLDMLEAIALKEGVPRGGGDDGNDAETEAH